MAVGRFPGLRQVPTQPPGSFAPIQLTLSNLGSGTVGYSTVSSPPAGRNVVAIRLERSPNGVTNWQQVAVPRRRRVSELPPPSTRPATKIVDKNATANGTTIFNTIQAALNVSVPGDEITVAPGTYTEKALFTRSGSAANPIRVRCADYNNKPTIDATFLSTSWNFDDLSSSAIVTVNAEYIIWDGINVINVRNNNQQGDWGGGLAFKLGAARNNGSFIFNSEKDTWYKGIRVYRSLIENCAMAIQTLMTEDYTIGGCTIRGTQKGNQWDSGVNPPITWGSGVSFTGRQGKFIENKVYQSMGEGLHVGFHIPMVADANPPLAMGHRDFVIRGCEFYDTWSGPIYLTVASGGVIEENLVFMSDDPRFWYNRSTATGYPGSCLGIGTELGQFGNPINVLDSSWAGIENVVIRNNILNGAAQIMPIIDYDPNQPISGYRNIKVEHNTIFATRGQFPSFHAAINNRARIEKYLMSGWEFSNNAVLVNDGSTLFDEWEPLGAGKVVRGNCFSHAPPADLASATNIIDPSAFVLADKAYVTTNTGGYPNPIEFDVTKAYPYLAEPVVSPLVDRVASIGTVRDFFGHTRPTATGRADIGAISLSMLNEFSESETGLAPGTYFYRATFVDSLGDIGVSDVKSIAV